MRRLLTSIRPRRIAGYHLFPSELMKMGRLSEGREEIEHAIAMTKNLREQELPREQEGYC